MCMFSNPGTLPKQYNDLDGNKMSLEKYSMWKQITKEDQMPDIERKEQLTQETSKEDCETDIQSDTMSKVSTKNSEFSISND